MESGYSTNFGKINKRSIYNVGNKKTDLDYQSLCNETKTNIKTKCRKYKAYLDQDFEKKLKTKGETISRRWELGIVEYLSEIDCIELINFSKNDKVKQPDFLFKHKKLGKNYFVECVCPTMGLKDNYPILHSISNRKSQRFDPHTSQWILSYFFTQKRYSKVDINLQLYRWLMCVCYENNKPRTYGTDHNRFGNEFRSRITSVFQNKADKYKLLIKEKKAGFIIAISLAKLHIGEKTRALLILSSEKHRIMSCFFSFNSIKVLERSRNNLNSWHGPCHNPEKSFSLEKKNHENSGCEIQSDFFEDKAFSHVSAVLFSAREKMILSIPEGNDFFLIHNPNAHIPLPKDILPVHNEKIVKEMTKEKITFE